MLQANTTPPEFASSVEVRQEHRSPINELIEITPKMVDAGVIALSDYDPREGSMEAAVYAVFKAMILSAHSTKS